MSAERTTSITPEEYLALEAASSVRHEYVAGHAYAMAGATDIHGDITGNWYLLLRAHVRGTSCRAYSVDMKVRIDAANCYYYPDVLVTCDERDRLERKIKKHPCLIVEVLSDSTEAFDRGLKFAHYRQLNSLQEYVIVSQDWISVECYRHRGNGEWAYHAWGPGDTVRLDSVGFSCSVEDVYDDVSPAPTADGNL